MSIKKHGYFELIKIFTQQVHTGSWSKLNQTKDRTEQVVFYDFKCKLCSFHVIGSKQTIQELLDLHRTTHYNRNQRMITGLDLF